MDGERFDAERLVAAAVAAAGSDDLGEPTWQAPLALLADGLRHEARLHELGEALAEADLVFALATRASLLAWRAEHPEVAEQRVDAPIVIVGQPRTGTTLLYDLLAQDPGLRAPLTWEVEQPVPPPEPSTYDSDPRIAESDAKLAGADVLMPGFTDHHPLGARLAQECVRMTSIDLRSMTFSLQYRLPTYERWLLDEADLASAYAWHRRYLQHLQSRHRGDRWLLKSPAHLWHLPALLAEYPDAVVVQTHRDPLRVIASVTALVALLRRMATDEVDVEEIGRVWGETIFLGLERGTAAREDGTLPADQVVDVHFTDVVADPLAQVARVYEHLGRPLTDDVRDRMRRFLAEHPGDGGGAGQRYRFADTGLDAEALRERARPYQERFGVVSERVA